MPYNLDLPKQIKTQGWKVKIQDRERLEPPHATVIYRGQVWRIDLRQREFMIPPGGTWKDLHDAVQETIKLNWQNLCDAWDERYPDNPVAGTENNSDEQ